MEHRDGFLSGAALEELEVCPIVHEHRLGEDGWTGRVAEDEEVGFEVGGGVAVKFADPLAGKVALGGGVEAAGEGVGPGDAAGGVGAPAGSFVPFPVRCGGVDVDADEDYVFRSEGGGNGSFALYALEQADVFQFRGEELGVEAEFGES